MDELCHFSNKLYRFSQVVCNHCHHCQRIAEQVIVWHCGFQIRIKGPLIWSCSRSTNRFRSSREQHTYIRAWTLKRILYGFSSIDTVYSKAVGISCYSVCIIARRLQVVASSIRSRVKDVIRVMVHNCFCQWGVPIQSLLWGNVCQCQCPNLR